MQRCVAGRFPQLLAAMGPDMGPDDVGRVYGCYRRLAARQDTELRRWGGLAGWRAGEAACMLPLWRLVDGKPAIDGCRVPMARLTSRRRPLAGSAPSSCCRCSSLRRAPPPGPSCWTRAWSWAQMRTRACGGPLRRPCQRWGPGAPPCPANRPALPITLAAKPAAALAGPANSSQLTALALPCRRCWASRTAAAQCCGRCSAAPSSCCATAAPPCAPGCSRHWASWWPAAGTRRSPPEGGLLQHAG